jgi:hypothetical protein
MDEEIALPEFDERDFMKKEFRKAKVAFVSFGFGIAMALICHGIWRAVDPSLRWPVCFLLAVCAIGFMMKILQLLKIDIASFGKRDWFGTSAFYFFTWLAIFILSINPPFYDASPPKIDAVVLPNVQPEGNDVLVAAWITDNTGVDEVVLQIDGAEVTVAPDGSGVYRHAYNGSASTYAIRATDDNGNAASYHGTINRVPEAIRFVPPEEPVGETDPIEVRVLKNLSDSTYRVYYEINGRTVNFSKGGDVGGFNIYTTTPEYVGWLNNSANVIHIYAEVIHYFRGIKNAYTQTIDGGEHTVTVVGDEALIGQKDSPAVKGLPRPQDLRTPGFEFFAAVAAVAGVFLLRRRKKK